MVSGTRGPSQIHTKPADLMDPLQIPMDPLGLSARSVWSVRIWLGPLVPDTRNNMDMDIHVILQEL